MYVQIHSRACIFKMILYLCLRQFFTAIVISVLLSQTSLAELRRRRHQQNHDADIFRRTEELTNEWSCRVPKKRLVYVHDVISSPDATWFPPAVVLFQCEAATGCCSSSEETCRHSETQRVSYVFKKLDHWNRESYQRLNFTNHTSCRCQRISQVIPMTNIP